MKATVAHYLFSHHISRRAAFKLQGQLVINSPFIDRIQLLGKVEAEQKRAQASLKLNIILTEALPPSKCVPQTAFFNIVMLYVCVPQAS